MDIQASDAGLPQNDIRASRVYKTVFAEPARIADRFQRGSGLSSSARASFASPHGSVASGMGHLRWRRSRVSPASRSLAVEVGEVAPDHNDRPDLFTWLKETHLMLASAPNVYRSMRAAGYPRAHCLKIALNR